MSERRLSLAAVIVALLLLAAGCSESEKPGAPSDPPRAAPAVVVPEVQPTAPAPAAPSSTPETAMPARAEGGATAASRGRTHYLSYCATCHGAGGNGDGPLSATLVPPPARHSDGSYMNPLSDEYLHRVIAEGGAAVGKSPSMAPWGGALSDAQIDDVVAYIRTLAEPAYAP